MTTALAERPATAFTTLTAAEIKDQVLLIQQVMEAVMEDGHHYGIIPGTPKPTLLKPGAEKLGLTFRLRPEYEVLPQSVLTDTLRIYRLKCRLVHINTHDSWGEGVGSCSSNERKFAKQIQGGFTLDDLDNTLFKMAAKRAHVAAVLSATAASDIFTQDLEEGTGNGEDKKVDAPKIPYGKEHKGKAINDPSVPPDFLTWLVGTLDEAIKDPKKATYKAKNEALRQAIDQELKRRESPPQGSDAEPDYKAGESTSEEALSFDRAVALLKSATTKETAQDLWRTILKDIKDWPTADKGALQVEFDEMLKKLK